MKTESDHPLLESNSSMLDDRRQNAWRVFLEWCFLREATGIRSFIVLLIPVLASAFLIRNSLWYFPLASPIAAQGRSLFHQILSVGIFFTFAASAYHASRAVCWEMSRELRDLVRLTGLNPLVLLWGRILAAWWTIFLSILLLVPLMAYARTLGGVTFADWLVAICWLILFGVLSAGFAMMASVSVTNATYAEATAGSATVILILLYHMLFWGPAAFLLIIAKIADEANMPSPKSLALQAATLVSDFAPIVSLFHSVNMPDLFSPLAPQYWIHFATATICIWLSTRVMRNRLRVTTVSDTDVFSATIQSESTSIGLPHRPRCRQRPFVWKDHYILGTGGTLAASWWKNLCWLAFFGVISSLFYGTSLEVGIFAMLIAPCLVAVYFDALFAAEFREKTWSSLMLLPVHPRIFVLSKAQVALWERRWLLLPLLTAFSLAALRNPQLTLAVATITLLAGILLIEISAINQLSAKSWWWGPFFVLSALPIAIGNLSVFLAVGPNQGFVVAILTLTMAIGFGLWFINYRLVNWSDE